MQVTKQKTPVSNVATANALRYLGLGSGVQFYLAHLILENGRGFNALYNYNFGNVKLWRDPGSTNYYVLTDNYSSTDKYQAYGSITAGLSDYAREIRRRPSVVSAAQNGDLLAFTRALYETEYIGVDTAHGRTMEEQIAETYQDLRSIASELGPLPNTTVILPLVLLALGSGVLYYLYS